MYNQKFCIIFCILFWTNCSNAVAEILWEQNFNQSPIWQSTPSPDQDVNGMNATHKDAISMWNASSYRIAKQKYNEGGTVLLEVSEIADRQESGRGLIYWFNAVNDWQAASIDIAFNDPDITWKTQINPDGYQEIWLTMWYRTPEDMVWFNPESPETAVGYELWKGCRFWAYSVPEYVNNYNKIKGTNFSTNANGHWQALVADNAILSSHYLMGGTFYKKPFFIITWYGQTLYSSPAWLAETDPDAGTSGFPSVNNRSDLNTHLVGGKHWFGGSIDIPGILNDNKWHKVEYHVKLNDLGSSNSIEEVYFDGKLLHAKANNQQIRITDRKIQQVILFDNYMKKYGGKQALYIDDIVISTDRLPSFYLKTPDFKL